MCTRRCAHATRALRLGLAAVDIDPSVGAGGTVVGISALPALDQFERLATKRKLKIDARLQAIGLMALMEGLWLQWSLDPKSFSVDEAKAVCLGSIAHLLG